MHGDSNLPRGLDLRAVGMGMIWGLVLMLIAVLAGTVVGSVAPSWQGSQTVTLVCQALGAFVGGFVAARRGQAVGWLHGAVAGALLALSLFGVMGIGMDDFPGLAAFLKVMGGGTALGMLGGVLGVNAR